MRYGATMLPESSNPVASILLVEDEILIAMQVEYLLEDLGLGVAASVAGVAAAMAAIDIGGFDAAMLDVSLSADPVWPVADRLADLGIPFLLCSGKVDDTPARHSRVPVLRKPYSSDELKKALVAVLPPH